MKSFSWMTATIQHKGIGSQQLLAAHKGANSPHLVQSKNYLSCRTGKTCYLSHRPEGHLPTPSCEAGACGPVVGVGRASRCVSIQVERAGLSSCWSWSNSGKLNLNSFLPGPLWSPVSSSHLCIRVVTNWIHLSRWCGSNYPVSKLPWRMTWQKSSSPLWSVSDL